MGAEPRATPDAHAGPIKSHFCSQKFQILQMVTPRFEHLVRDGRKIVSNLVSRHTPPVETISGTGPVARARAGGDGARLAPRYCRRAWQGIKILRDNACGGAVNAG